MFKGYSRVNPNLHVALKRIYFTSRPSRVENEIRFLLELGGKHNVIKMVEGLRHQDEITLVLEHFDHTNFKELLKTITVREMQLYLRSLFEALAFIHALDVVHHDIKPSNFLFDRRTCRGVLVDFGLAQYQKKSLVSSTPAQAGTAAATSASTSSSKEKKENAASATAATAATSTAAAAASSTPKAKKGAKRALPSPESTAQAKRKKGFLPSADLHNVEQVSALIPQAATGTSPKAAILINDPRSLLFLSFSLCFSFFLNLRP